MLKRTPLKRTPFRKKSLAGTSAVKLIAYRDSQGIELSDVWRFLHGRPSDWPTVVRVHDETICKLMHEWFNECWNCGRMNVQCHHIIGGTKGRSDELTNIAMLCGPNLITGDEGCHAKANTNELPMGRILLLKCRWDWQHTNWVRLCLLARQFLAIE